jgi:hypothetical protein
MILTMELSPSWPSVEVDDLARRVVADSPIEEDFRAIQDSDLVVFQKEDALSPPFLNRRFSEYEKFVQREATDVPFNTRDITMYSMLPSSSTTSLSSDREVATR